MMQYTQWHGFKGGEWQRAIDVRSFIQKNYTLYEGDDSFLVPPDRPHAPRVGKVREAHSRGAETGYPGRGDPPHFWHRQF